jgi:hypothetical protein
MCERHGLTKDKGDLLVREGRQLEAVLGEWEELYESIVAASGRCFFYRALLAEPRSRPLVPVTACGVAESSAREALALMRDAMRMESPVWVR